MQQRLERPQNWGLPEEESSSGYEAGAEREKKKAKARTKKGGESSALAQQSGGSADCDEPFHMELDEPVQGSRSKGPRGG